ncbi:amidohydrolase family protein [Streptomyces sp. NPDC050161]|uniref:amidohydrolase family protein n=1 Tax=Streptomyces sp. NPDC050161 TaxID=3365604 RepID=UPI0037BCCA95
MPKLVDVHAHCLPRAYRQAAHDAGLTSFDGGFPIPSWSIEAALDFMDSHRITAQVLSVTSPPVHVLAGADGAAALAARTNEEIAEIVTLHPDRFTATAVLPLPDVTATLKTIGHCFDALGMCGATLFTHYQGHYLGDPLYEPVFAALNDRHALILLHPTSPVCAEQTRLGRPAPVIEFPLDTTRAVVNLLYTGTLQRYPNLRIVVPHAGAAVPALAWRIAHFADALPLPGKQDTRTATAVMAQLHALYYDVALSANQHALAALRTVADPARILFGSDYPFAPESVVQDNITGLASSSHLTEGAREAIGHRNALTLLPALRHR